MDLMARADNREVLLYLSLINWGEMYYILERDHGEKVAKEFIADMDSLPIIIGEVDRRRVLSAAHVKARYPVSYADAFAIALADELEAPVVTGDPEFKKVESVITVLWLREV